VGISDVDLVTLHWFPRSVWRLPV